MESLVGKVFTNGVVTAWVREESYGAMDCSDGTVSDRVFIETESARTKGRCWMDRIAFLDQYWPLDDPPPHQKSGQRPTAWDRLNDQGPQLRTKVPKDPNVCQCCGATRETLLRAEKEGPIKMAEVLHELDVTWQSSHRQERKQVGVLVLCWLCYMLIRQLFVEEYEEASVKPLRQKLEAIERVMGS